MSTWTFGGVAFTWLRTEVNGHPAMPTWTRKPRLVERELLDSGDADIARVGFTAKKVSGPIYVAAANAAAFEALNGTQAALSNGTSSWQAVLDLDLVNLAIDGGASGEATFTRPRA